MWLLVWSRFIMSHFATFCTVSDNGFSTSDILIVFAMRFVYINFEIA